MAPESATPEPSFRHEALLYSGEAEFVETTAAFPRDGLVNGDTMLAVVDAPKIRRIRAALGPDADRVQFADMARVGRNPALIIQAWRDEPDFWLVCPYDTMSLPEPVVDHAIVNHPFVCDGGDHRSSATHALDHSADFTRPPPAARRRRRAEFRRNGVGPTPTVRERASARGRCRTGALRRARGCRVGTRVQRLGAPTRRRRRPSVGRRRARAV